MPIRLKTAFQGWKMSEKRFVKPAYSQAFTAWFSDHGAGKRKSPLVEGGLFRGGERSVDTLGLVVFSVVVAVDMVIQPDMGAAD